MALFVVLGSGVVPTVSYGRVQPHPPGVHSLTEAGLMRTQDTVQAGTI